jgi:hypothetical protein
MKDFERKVEKSSLKNSPSYQMLKWARGGGGLVGLKS